MFEPRLEFETRLKFFNFAPVEVIYIKCATSDVNCFGSFWIVWIVLEKKIKLPRIQSCTILKIAFTKLFNIFIPNKNPKNYSKIIFTTRSFSHQKFAHLALCQILTVEKNVGTKRRKK